MQNPLLSLPFEPSLENLGDSFWDVVEAAKFPITKLRFRNNDLLQQINIESSAVLDRHFEEAYGQFKERNPLLALRYHGYQFGTYNPFLGDGRGFLYGQLRDRNGLLQDLGTKGSGKTPWSRGGDGRLTLKGGVREIIAGEALHRLGVNTSRTLSLIETGEKLWREDEPSPTRSSVMVRIARTHLRFGTCERLLYLRQPKLLTKLLSHVINIYYPEVGNNTPISCKNSHIAGKIKVLAFYEQLVKRIAKLTAEWMAAGFIHGVLNTDNMSLAGESFDYGPFAFLERWNPSFTSAYFDETGLYAFGRQPAICYNNLRLLQEPLAMIISKEQMSEKLDSFFEIYETHYQVCLFRRLGLPTKMQEKINQFISSNAHEELLSTTLQLLATWDINYGDFFSGLTKSIKINGLPDEAESLVPDLFTKNPPPRKVWLEWRNSWWNYQNLYPKKNPEDVYAIQHCLERWNLSETPIRSVIAKVWESIDQNNDWAAFDEWIRKTTLLAGSKY